MDAKQYKKALLVSDCAVTRPMLEEYFGFLADRCEEVVYLEDLVGYTDIQFQELMLGVEQNGPESYDALPALVEEIRDAEIVVAHMSIFNRKVLEGAKKIQLLGVCRGGVDNVNLDCVHEKGIRMINAASRSSDSVADFTAAIMVAEMKNIVRAAIELHENKWVKTFPNVGNNHNMRRQVVGIIGYGEIGMRVATRLKAFGCEIVVHDPFLSDADIKTRGAKPVSLEALLRTSDVVTIHLRLSEKTAGFLGREQFELMKPTAYFINNARAGLVDEGALLEVLRTHRIAGAALDVFSEEPLPEDSVWQRLDNVTLTPHIAGVSCDTVRNGVELVSQDVQKFMDGQTLRYL